MTLTTRSCEAVVSEPLLATLITAVATVLVGGGVYVGHILTSRSAKRAQVAQGEHWLVTQLREELSRYRERTDARLDLLEAENRGYRAFIGIQRDHMAAHNIPLPDWPEGLPR